MIVVAGVLLYETFLVEYSGEMLKVVNPHRP